MIYYFIYRFGQFIALALPVKISYRFACFLADICYFVFKKDNSAIIENLRIVTANSVDEKELRRIAREVFRNFGKYLVDFFRFSKIDSNYIKKFVKIEGRENIDRALAAGKGVIMLSAHIGNWELGGFVLSQIGYPLSAVVLTHKNKMVNDFFKKQRLIGKMQPVEIGLSLRSCYAVLKRNELLAMLGDRDFSGHGLDMDFFGRKAVIPRGPAFFSHRLGSAMVSAFMIRQPDDTFKLIFGEPIFPDSNSSEEDAVRSLTAKYLSVLESYIAKYPSQWYVFRKIWNGDARPVHTDTII